MRILILGAGAIGGYFGARFHDAGADVTFLVRPRRTEQLKAIGLRISSPLGDAFVPSPRLASAETLRENFDVVVLSCKAYDFDSAVAAIAPAIGDHSAILPLLNGIAHLEALDTRFGRERVLGGVAHLAVTLTPGGEIQHLNRIHLLTAGARTKNGNRWLEPLERLFDAISPDFGVSSNIEHDMWEKFMFLTTLAAATCTMRANLGAILETVAGRDFILGLLGECQQTAAAFRHPPDPARLVVYRQQLTESGSILTASMLRDVEAGNRTEADHILGDMLKRAKKHGIETPLLRIAYSHLQAYERVRSAA